MFEFRKFRCGAVDSVQEPAEPNIFCGAAPLIRSFGYVSGAKIISIKIVSVFCSRLRIPCGTGIPTTDGASLYKRLNKPKVRPPPHLRIISFDIPFTEQF